MKNVMSDPVPSTVAQLLYSDQRAFDFARIVAELETILSRFRGDLVDIEWDCDDLITFALPEARIVLSFAEYGQVRRESCLTIAVGPSQDIAADEPSDAGALAVLCSRLVERILLRHTPDAVLWREVTGPVTADMVDDWLDHLPKITPRPHQAQVQPLPSIDSILDSVVLSDRAITGLPPPRQKPKARGLLRAPLKVVVRTETPVAANLPANAALKTAAPSLTKAPASGIAGQTAILPFAIPRKDGAALAAGKVAANDQPDLPRPRDAELVTMRDALYADQETPSPVYSTQMRLAAHCFNATLILIWAPLGAAVMTYSLLRGENMQLSARLMAVAGTLFALAQTPLGHTVKAMAGV